MECLRAGSACILCKQVKNHILYIRSNEVSSAGAGYSQIPYYMFFGEACFILRHHCCQRWELYLFYGRQSCTVAGSGIWCWLARSEGRLLRFKSTQTVENGKGVWWRKCLDDFEWQNVTADAIGTHCQMERWKKCWEVQLAVGGEWVPCYARRWEANPNGIIMMQQMVGTRLKASCAGMKMKTEEDYDHNSGVRATFENEVGRWQGLNREVRIGKECGSAAVEVQDWLMECPAWLNLRCPLMQDMERLVNRVKK